MDEAYRDRASAALARVEALEQELRDLRATNAALSNEIKTLRETSKRVPPVRHSGGLVVAGVIMVIGSLLGAALFMRFQIRTEPTTTLTTIDLQHSSPAK